MSFSVYARILGIRDARNALLLGLLIRAPMWAGSIILTLHVVTTLGHSYSAAGLLTTCSTVALAVSAPWRGRLLDVRGLRRTVLPQLVVLATVWSIAPWVGYWLLLPLAFVGGLFVVPTFSIVRQVLISAVDDRQRTAALSLDSFATELSFMVGPVAGVLAATYLDTRWALFGAEMLTVLGGVLVWILNPRLLREEDQATEHVGTRSWLSPLVIAILAASAASTVVLTGTDLGIVAALRSMGHPESIGWVLAIWGLGSAVGALVYGALHRAVPVFLLLALLSATTLPVVLANNRFTLTVLLFVAGFFCAPTITATIDHLSRVVPPRARGEVMGWHGSSLTIGSALGAPIAGVAIDRGGWEAGFLVTALVGLAVAVAGLVAVSRRRAAVPLGEAPEAATAPAPAPTPADV
jgi:predicted MFS family arabinose efflux permease